MIFTDNQLRLETPTAKELAVFDRSQVRHNKDTGQPVDQPGLKRGKPAG
jgi:hypothetical protein